MHSSFKKKPVVQLVCRFCDSCICKRGMKAVLLADTNMELYSTDAPCAGKISNVDKPYSTGKCECRISDTACNHCGNNVGYTIMIPCVPCLQSCNNGHLWIFNSTVVWAEGQLDKSGCDVLRWDSLSECPGDDNSQESFHEDKDDIDCIR
ncbi:protein FAM72A-like [Strongylocentrotus purpuratus]|uniref:Protein FAM72A n=1 Tax=Strongylocentrotus purpuratus TaxID=7668 RepID=A0A7M7N0K2_STRPU|nr:protein FAM72A-like [Strongylocentrotus purpuratus]